MFKIPSTVDYNVKVFDVSSLINSIEFIKKKCFIRKK